MPLDDTGPAPASAPDAGTPPAAPDIRGLIDQSRQMGASDEQIRGLMLKAPFLADTWQASAKAGISPDAVFQHFGLSATPHQSQAVADLNALGQGLVGGTGSAVTGAGRIASAAGARGTSQQLATMDAIDAGKDVPQDQDPLGYQFLDQAQRAKARADLTATTADTEPNPLVRAGQAIKDYANTAMPVSPENEGVQTGVARMVGGTAPAIAASAVGGPLATMAVVGTQAYDNTYDDAINKGATHDEADAAASKSAVTQAALMVAPIGRLMQTVPMPFRDGLAKTLMNLGQHGIEFGSANALSTVANNYVAQQSYDPSRPLTKGMGQAGLEGAITGLVVPAAGGAIRTVRQSAGDAVAAIGSAPDIDSAIAAAGKAAEAPPEPAALADDIMQPPGSLPTSEPTAEQNALQPETQSVSAAASREQTPQAQIELSTTDMKANRRTAEMNELQAPPQAGDSTVYVPGSFPTLAERSGDPVVSQTENLLRQRNPGAFIGDGKILTENNKARVNAYDANTVSDTTLNSMRRDRQDQWVQDAGSILPNANPADLTPVKDWVDTQLSDPRIQENDAVRSVLTAFRNRLFDANGALKDDPAAVWGIHDNLQNQLAKAKDPLNATGAERYAEAQIIEAKRLIDQTLNVATNGKFQTAIDNYAAASKAINSGVILNDFRPKLTNMNGDLQAANFHRFVVALAKERGNPGIDPSMDISDDTMRSLIGIDTDLKRAGLIKLGAAAGSPTNLLGALAERLGMSGAHSVLGSIPAVGPLLKAGKDLYDQHQLENLTQKHLAPPEGGYAYHPIDQQQP